MKEERGRDELKSKFMDKMSWQSSALLQKMSAHTATAKCHDAKFLMHVHVYRHDANKEDGSSHCIDLSRRCTRRRERRRRVDRIRADRSFASGQKLLSPLSFSPVSPIQHFYMNAIAFATISRVSYGSAAPSAIPFANPPPATTPSPLQPPVD